MSAIDLRALFRRFDTAANATMEAAAARAVRHSHATIELAHWLAALCEDTDGRALISDCGGHAGDIAGEVETVIGSAPGGHAGPPALSQPMIHLAREAWVTASLAEDADRVSLAHLLHTALDDSSTHALIRRVAPSLKHIDLPRLAGRSHELPAVPGDGKSTPNGPAAGSVIDEAIAPYVADMTAAAHEGRIDPVIGREEELRQVIDALVRRRQNNPILVGDAGVGKTAIVEALALRLAAGDVPARLEGVRILALDLSLLQAGAGVKGEFERRLTELVNAVRNSAEPTILFIDEAHVLIGAGGQPGQGDAANILKPALARGELRTIAATTWGEYKRHIERDPALTRRFQLVKVNEPDHDTAVRMMRGLAAGFAKHHGVTIRDEALHAAVELSARYIPSRQLPDKAVAVLDTACATVALSRESEPPRLSDLAQEVQHLTAEREKLASEPGTDATATRIGEIDVLVRDLEGRLDEARAGFGSAIGTMAKADALESGLIDIDPRDRGDVAKRIAALDNALAGTDTEGRLVHRVVDREAVAEVIARATGIPVTRMLKDEADTVQTLADRLAARVIGQRDALKTIADTVMPARANLADPSRPPGVFLLAGPSGVGKTETALALADILYGGRQQITVINMSEFKEEHKVSTLLGSPPGYVGYGEGGVLTEAVRRRPYGVLLLDEIDKAHPGVQEIFYQLFDKGTLADGEGREVDFKNTTILMTANTGAELITMLAEDRETMPRGPALQSVVETELAEHFKPAFLGRLTVVPYLPLDHDEFAAIADMQLAAITERVRGSYGTTLVVDDTARDKLTASAHDSATGARAVISRIDREVLPTLSAYFLSQLAGGTVPVCLTLSAAPEGFVVSEADNQPGDHAAASKSSAGRTPTDAYA